MQPGANKRTCRFRIEAGPSACVYDTQPGNLFQRMGERRFSMNCSMSETETHSSHRYGLAWSCNARCLRGEQQHGNSSFLVPLGLVSNHHPNVLTGGSAGRGRDRPCERLPRIRTGNYCIRFFPFPHASVNPPRRCPGYDSAEKRPCIRPRNPAILAGHPPPPGSATATSADASAAPPFLRI